LGLQVTIFYKNDHDPKGRHLQYGLVAEDVARVAPTLVSYNKNGKADGVYYRFLGPMLLNEEQKLQQTIKAQRTLLEKQAKEIAVLKAQASVFKQQAAEIDRLKLQMARIDRLFALRQGSK
jgi:hypothetical protein